jgi:hypothetical protein
MNRAIIYTQEQVRSFDVLWGMKDTLYAAAFLQQDLAGGITSVVSGLAASQTSPASLSINLTAGRAYQQSALDGTTYGALPSDPTLVMQQGFSVAQSVALTTGALSAGQSQWALVQAQFSQSDIIRAGDPTNGVLYYWNSANPSQPFQGPGNTGAANNTERASICTVSVVYGAAATTGSEVPPTPAAGFIPLYLIDLTFGQTQITNSQIKTAGPSVGTGVPSNYPGAPFLAGLLFQHHKGTPGQAPQIDLTSEVKNTLPLTNLPGSDTVGGIPVMKLNAGNPNGSVAGNASVNGASDFAFDTINKILYVCTVTGTTSTAVWTAVVGSTSSQFAGVTTTGTANAQVVSSTTPSGFSLTPGYVVTTTIGAGLNNTGASTLNVDATGAIAINKVSGGSNVPLVGGELVAGQFLSFIYTGSVWLLQANSLGALATLGIGQWLQSVAGNLTIKNGLTLGDDGAGNLTVQPGSITPAMLDVSAAKQRSFVAPTSTQGGGNLTMSNDGTSPNFVVDIAVGRVSSDDDTTLIQLAAAMTKRLDQSWAPGTGNGACDTSTKGNSQTWHAYAIGRTGMTVTNVQRTSNVASLTVAAHNLGVGSTVRVLGCGQGLDGLQVVTAVTTNTFNYSNSGSNITSQAAAPTALASGFDVLFSQSYPSPTMPTNYNVKQCLGSILTNSSGNIILFTQYGDEFLWTAPPTDSTSISGGPTNYALSVPNGVAVEAIVNVYITMNASTVAQLFLFTPGGSASAAPTIANFAPTTGGIETACNARCVTNTSKQVAITASGNNASILSTLGWRDFRRRLF